MAMTAVRWALLGWVACAAAFPPAAVRVNVAFVGDADGAAVLARAALAELRGEAVGDAGGVEALPLQLQPLPAGCSVLGDGVAASQRYCVPWDCVNVCLYTAPEVDVPALLAPPSGGDNTTARYALTHSIAAGLPPAHHAAPDPAAAAALRALHRPHHVVVATNVTDAAAALAPAFPGAAVVPAGGAPAVSEFLAGLGVAAQCAAVGEGANVDWSPPLGPAVHEDWRSAVLAAVPPKWVGTTLVVAAILWLAVAAVRLRRDPRRVLRGARSSDDALTRRLSIATVSSEESLPAGASAVSMTSLPPPCGESSDMLPIAFTESLPGSLHGSSLPSGGRRSFDTFGSLVPDSESVNPAASMPCLADLTLGDISGALSDPLLLRNTFERLARDSEEALQGALGRASPAVDDPASAFPSGWRPPDLSALLPEATVEEHATSPPPDAPQGPAPVPEDASDAASEAPRPSPRRVPGWLARWVDPPRGGGPHAGVWRECCVTLEVPGEGAVCAHLRRGPVAVETQRCTEPTPASEFAACSGDAFDADEDRAASPSALSLSPRTSLRSASPPRHEVVRRPLRLKEVDDLLAAAGQSVGAGEGVPRPVAVPYPTAAEAEEPNSDATDLPPRASLSTSPSFPSRPLGVPHWSCCGSTDPTQRLCPYSSQQTLTHRAFKAGARAVGAVRRWAGAARYGISGGVPWVLSQVYRLVCHVLWSPREAVHAAQKKAWRGAAHVKAAVGRVAQRARKLTWRDLPILFMAAAKALMGQVPRLGGLLARGVRAVLGMLYSVVVNACSAVMRYVSTHRTYIRVKLALRRWWNSTVAAWRAVKDKAKRALYYVAWCLGCLPALVKAANYATGTTAAIWGFGKGCQAWVWFVVGWCRDWLVFFLHPPDPTAEYRPPIDIRALPKKTALARHLKASGVSQLEALRQLERASNESSSHGAESDEDAGEDVEPFADALNDTTQSLTMWAPEDEDLHDLYLSPSKRQSQRAPSLTGSHKPRNTTSMYSNLLGDTLRSVVLDDFASNHSNSPRRETTRTPSPRRLSDVALSMARPQRVSHGTQTGKRLMRELKREAIWDLVPKDSHPSEASPAPATPLGRAVNDDTLFEALVKQPWNKRHMLNPQALRAKAMREEREKQRRLLQEQQTLAVSPTMAPRVDEVRVPEFTLSDQQVVSTALEDVELIDPRKGHRVNHYAAFHTGTAAIKSPDHPMLPGGSPRRHAADPVVALVGPPPPLPDTVHKTRRRVRSPQRFGSVLGVDTTPERRPSARLRRRREDQFLEASPAR